MALVRREAARMSFPPDVEPDDVIQNVLVRLFLQPARLAAIRHPAGYLRAALYHEIISVLRRRRAVAAIDIDELAEASSSIQKEPSSMIDSKTGAMIVQRLLSSLSPAERELIDLRFWGRQSITEIADALGTSYGAAAVRLFRLLKKLRDSKILDKIDPLDL